MNARRQTQGFTLVELLISLSMASILAATALPSYQQQVLKSRRADAMQAMSLVVQQQERYRSQNHGYAEDLQTLGLSDGSAAGHYRLVLSEVSETGFTLSAQARAQGLQSQDETCQVLTQVLSKGTLRLGARHRDGNTTTAQCWPQ